MGQASQASWVHGLAKGASFLRAAGWADRGRDARAHASAAREAQGRIAGAGFLRALAPLFLFYSSLFLFYSCVLSRRHDTGTQVTPPAAPRAERRAAPRAPPPPLWPSSRGGCPSALRAPPRPPQRRARPTPLRWAPQAQLTRCLPPPPRPSPRGRPPRRPSPARSRRQKAAAAGGCCGVAGPTARPAAAAGRLAAAAHARERRTRPMRRTARGRPPRAAAVAPRPGRAPPPTWGSQRGPHRSPAGKPSRPLVRANLLRALATPCPTLPARTSLQHPHDRPPRISAWSSTAAGGPPCRWVRVRAAGGAP